MIPRCIHLHDRFYTIYRRTRHLSVKWSSNRVYISRSSNQNDDDEIWNIERVKLLLRWCNLSSSSKNEIILFVSHLVVNDALPSLVFRKFYNKSQEKLLQTNERLTVWLLIVNLSEDRFFAELIYWKTCLKRYFSLFLMHTKKK